MIMESVRRDPNQVARLSAQEEALKRNTDCVYFLASPFTCKKGNDCLYRHSEGARMNPRDCWFWLNGNCLNLKCAFRHPPLEGLLGSTGAKGSSGSLDSSQPLVAVKQMPAAHSTASNSAKKQTVPCFYFQKGLCLKGDWCPFMHGSQKVVSAAPQQIPKGPISNSFNSVKALGDSVQIPPVNAVKLVEVLPASNIVKTEVVLDKEIVSKKLPTPSYEDLPSSEQINLLPFSENMVSIHQPWQVQVPDDHLENGREAGEFLRESSPGFDVLVDSELENSDYYLHDDEYGRVVGNGGRHHMGTEYDYGHLSEHEYVTSCDVETNDEFSEYDQYGRKRDQYGWDHHKFASERILERSSVMERKPREETIDQIESSDLRHLLSKRRRLSGSRSARTPGECIDICGGERRWGKPHTDQRCFSPKCSMSNRLQGRVTLPGRSSLDKANGLRSERGNHQRSWRKSSLSRPVSYLQGRHYNGVKRTRENSADFRNPREQVRRDVSDSPSFAGPKSLAELKACDRKQFLKKNDAAYEFKSPAVGDPRTMKSGRTVDQSDCSLSFEGPKTLSEILKRKRREAGTGNGTVSSDGCREGMHPVNSSIVAASDAPSLSLADHKNALELNADSVKTANSNGIDDPRTTLMEDDCTMMDTTEDQEQGLEEHDQRNGESDYETGDCDYKNDDENQEEEDYMDVDDDDFLSKIGAILS